MDNIMHPIQKIVDGRFVPNKIVEYLLDKGGIDMNELAVQGFTQQDREQFAQLIGYSLSGYADLSYVSDEAYSSASTLCKNPYYTEMQARNEVLRETVNECRRGIKIATEALFKIHPDDLTF